MSDEKLLSEELKSYRKKVFILHENEWYVATHAVWNKVSDGVPADKMIVACRAVKLTSVPEVVERAVALVQMFQYEDGPDRFWVEDIGFINSDSHKCLCFIVGHNP